MILCENICAVPTRGASSVEGLLSTGDSIYILLYIFCFGFWLFLLYYIFANPWILWTMRIGDYDVDDVDDADDGDNNNKDNH